MIFSTSFPQQRRENELNDLYNFVPYIAPEYIDKDRVPIPVEANENREEDVVKELDGPIKIGDDSKKAADQGLAQAVHRIEAHGSSDEILLPEANEILKEPSGENDIRVIEVDKDIQTPVISQKLSEFSGIHAGIADKYLEFDNNLSVLPQSSNPGEGVDILPNQLRLTSSLFAPAVKRKKYIIQNESSTLKLYSTRDITSDDKVIFVFAGRKNNASYPDKSGNCRVIAVMTEQEYENSQLPEHIDIMVIKNLSSRSHGNFSANLGCINSRRIAAMLMAHELGLNSCIFMDDNLESINTLTDLPNWEQLFDALSLHAKGRVCLSVKTHQGRAKACSNETIGSKFFMVNMAKLKEIFPNRQDIFSLFYSNSCSNYLAEDYVMQIVMMAAFGAKSVGIADKNCFSLSRLKQHTNACVEVTRKGEELMEGETDEFFSKHFNKIELSNLQVCWIKSALATLKRIVRENIESRKHIAQGIKNTDLVKQHAKANDIIMPANEQDETIDESVQEALSINDFGLYDHQNEAIKAVEESESKFDLLKMATGSGKTRIQIAMSQILLSSANTRPVFIVTPTQQLVKQFYSDFIEYIDANPKNIKPYQVVKISSHMSDISVSLLQANASLENKKLVMIFCRESFLKYIEQSKVIVPQSIFLDECHKINKEQAKAIKSRFSQHPTRIIALSATPSKEMGNAIFEYTRTQAIKDKIVSPFILDTFDKDFSDQAVEEQIKHFAFLLNNHKHPNGSRLNQLKGIIYLPSIKMAENAHEILEKNIKVFKAHSKVKRHLNQVEDFKNTEQPCLILVVGMLRAGFSDKNVDYELILRNGQPDDIKQIIGRVLRFKEGKVGYVLGFSNINTSSLIPGYNEEALDMCDEAFREQSPHLFVTRFKDQNFMPSWDSTNSLRFNTSPTILLEGKAAALESNEEKGEREQRILYHNDVYSFNRV